MNIYVVWLSGHYSVVMGNTLIDVYVTKNLAIAQASSIAGELVRSGLKVNIHVCKM
jgi:hypothetical protein